MSNSYFDLHFHPMFKQYISHYEANYPSTRSQEDLEPIVRIDNDLMHDIDHDMLHFLESQSCFDQIKAANYLLSVANVVTLEYGLAAADNFLGAVLKGKITDPLDKHYFTLLTTDDISYYKMMVKELNLYGVLANIGTFRSPTRKPHIDILTRKNPTIDLDNLSRTTMAMAIEGSHNLCRGVANHTVSADMLDRADENGTDHIYLDFKDTTSTLVSPADSLRRLFAAMWAEDMDIFYLTLTHLTNIVEQPIATHAYGMKKLKHYFFYPMGIGITDDGVEVVKAAYGMTADGGTKKTPVLIDVKHMSLKSRLDLYKLRKEVAPNMPIMASHMAVTGYSIRNWKDAIDDSLTKKIKTGYDKNPKVVAIHMEPQILAFENTDPMQPCKFRCNAWSLNLMDEDIVEILQSGGLIGLILDSRVLGADVTLDYGSYDFKEYLSVEEYDYFFTHGNDGPFDASPTTTDAGEYAQEEFLMLGNYNGDQGRDPDRMTISWVLNLLHVLAVGIDKAGVDPWSQVTIGSDYDGMIEPVKKAYTCDQFVDNGMELAILRFIELVEPSYLYHHPIAQGYILPRDGSGNVDKSDLKQKIRNIMYNNGKEFMKKWYNGTLGQ